MHFRNEPLTFANMLKSPVSFLVEPQQQKKTVFSILIEKANADDDQEDGMILMKMGNIMEMKLTVEPEEFENMHKTKSKEIQRKETISNNQTSKETISNKQKNPNINQTLSDPTEGPYAFCHSGSLLVRSQIDCADKRLPRHAFDIKTRACLPIRMDMQKYRELANYCINSTHGLLNSFEREYYDMARSAFLKYSFQVKLGNMDGIFVAFHNVFEIFGFQYISRQELDHVLYGNSMTGEVCHLMMMRLFTGVMERIVDQFPYSKEPFRVIFDVKKHKLMNIFVERYPANSAFNSQAIPISLHHFTLHLYAQINGIRTENILLDPNGSDDLDIYYEINHVPTALISEYLDAKRRMVRVKPCNDNFISNILKNKHTSSFKRFRS